MSDSKMSQRRLTAREREHKAMGFRLAGFTYAQIAKELGMSEAGAHKAVTRALKRLNEKLSEQAEELRRMELERLDNMFRVMWSQVLNGNQGAVDRALRIMKRRAEMLGLDAPKNLDLTTDGKPLSVRFIWERVRDDD